MDKKERLEYMRQRYFALENGPQSEGVIEPTAEDVTEEIKDMDTFGEHSREMKENVLLSDEI